MANRILFYLCISFMLLEACETQSIDEGIEAMDTNTSQTDTLKFIYDFTFDSTQANTYYQSEHFTQITNRDKYTGGINTKNFTNCEDKTSSYWAWTRIDYPFGERHYEAYYFDCNGVEWIIQQFYTIDMFEEYLKANRFPEEFSEMDFSPELFADGKSKTIFTQGFRVNYRYIEDNPYHLWIQIQPIQS